MRYRTQILKLLKFTHYSFQASCSEYGDWVDLISSYVFRCNINLGYCDQVLLAYFNLPLRNFQHLWILGMLQVSL